MSDNQPRDRGFDSDHHPELGLNVVSPRHCVACNACHARFTRVGATCQSCGADHALVGVTILPLTAAETLFEPRATPRNRQSERHFRLAFWRPARIRH